MKEWPKKSIKKLHLAQETKDPSPNLCFLDRSALLGFQSENFLKFIKQVFVLCWLPFPTPLVSLLSEGERIWGTGNQWKDT